MKMPTKVDLPSHYKVLSLPEPTATSSAPIPTEIKLAYKRALLLHHPDKKDTSTHRSSTTNPSIDQITHAYRILSTPSARVAYDRHFLLSTSYQNAPNLEPVNDTVSHSGLETIDLDEMHYDAESGVYYRSCRCGRERAYTIRNEDLEAHADEGEMSIGCEGCSLWVRVEYLVEVEEEK